MEKKSNSEKWYTGKGIRNFSNKKYKNFHKIVYNSKTLYQNITDISNW